MATKGETTRENILQIAQNLMLQKGFSGTSIDEIIDMSNITKSGFFYHFDNKNDLAKHLMLKYQREDDAFFTSLFEQANDLSEDPLQQMLIFLKLLAQAMEDLQTVHPGCLVATFTSANHQLSDEVKQVTADCTIGWRKMFAEKLDNINKSHSTKTEVSSTELADMLSTIIEGGIIMSRTLSDQSILVKQILHYRDHLRLQYTDID